MSDDDSRNVAAIERLMREELSPAYPHVKFAVFDTGNGWERKIAIPASAKSRIASIPPTLFRYTHRLSIS